MDLKNMKIMKNYIIKNNNVKREGEILLFFISNTKIKYVYE